MRYSSLSLSVLPDNPAWRLYERLGFETVGICGMSLVMQGGSLSVAAVPAWSGRSSGTDFRNESPFWRPKRTSESPGGEQDVNVGKNPASFRPRLTIRRGDVLSRE